MEKKRKGLILSDPMERYIELDHSYWFINLSKKVIPKKDKPKDNKRKTYSDLELNNRDLIRPEIDSCMVISMQENDSCHLYFVVDRNDNVLEVMPVIRTNEKASRKKHTIIRKTSDYGADYVKFDEIKKIIIKEDFNIEYYLTIDDRSRIIKLHKKFLNRKNKPKSKISYEFGDVLSLHNTSEKIIFICVRDGLLYTCNINSDDMFTGLCRITKDKVVGKYDELNIFRKQKLLSNLERALELDNVIPKRVTDPVKKLVLENKNK